MINLALGLIIGLVAGFVMAGIMQMSKISLEEENLLAYCERLENELEKVKSEQRKEG